MEMVVDCKTGEESEGEWCVAESPDGQSDGGQERAGELLKIASLPASISGALAI